MKKIIALLLMLLLVFSFAACGGDETNETSDSQTDSNVEEPADTPAVEHQGVQLLERGYSMNDEYVIFAFIVENPDDVAYEFHTVNVTAYDKNGDVLATTEQTMNRIEPNEKQAQAFLMSCNGDTPDKVEFTVDTGSETSPKEDAIKSSDLEITGSNEREGEYGDISVTGKIKNNSTSDADTLAVTAVFRKGGEIVWGETTFVDSVGAGKEKAFEVSTYNVPEHDSFEVYAHDWSF